MNRGLRLIALCRLLAGPCQAEMGDRGGPDDTDQGVPIPSFFLVGTFARVQRV